MACLVTPRRARRCALVDVVSITPPLTPAPNSSPQSAR
jgi:hypothetical protein